MSDYTKPISDDEVRRLSDAIETFADDVNKKIDLQTALLDRTLGKQYAVNHEPKIELPFDNEYKYVLDKLAPTFVDKGGLDRLTHIFISGYLPNGKIIKLNDTEVSNNGSSVSKYDSMYINGSKCTGNYICRAEEGGWEKLNIMVVQRPSDSINGVEGRVDIDYADMPLENFKMLIYDDVITPLHPNIYSFIDSKQIDTLKCIGTLYWTCDKLSNLRALHVTKNIITVNDMYLPCLQEFICPNVTNMPNINVNSGDKGSLLKLDISNCKGPIANLQNINIHTDLSLQCSALASSAFSNAKITKLDTGPYCTAVYDHAVYNTTATEVVFGEMTGVLENESCNSNSKLVKIIFKSAGPVKMDSYNSLANNAILNTVIFSYISVMSNSCLTACRKLVNLTFIDNSISCKLYFQSQEILSEQSCLNIVNAIKAEAKQSVSLHSVIREHMKNDWYCKLDNDKYISCESTDEGAMTQHAAFIEKGWTVI